MLPTKCILTTHPSIRLPSLVYLKEYIISLDINCLIKNIKLDLPKGTSKSFFLDRRTLFTISHQRCRLVFENTSRFKEEWGF